MRILRFLLCFLLVAIGSTFIKNRFMDFDYSKSSLLLCLALLLFYEICITVIHELTHVCIFKICGIKIAVFCIPLLSAYRQQSKWKAECSLRFGLGGMVIPNLPMITDDTCFDKLRKIYQCSFVTAPLVSLIIGLLISVYLRKTTEFFVNSPVLCLVECGILILSLNDFISSFFYSNNDFGDMYLLFKFNDKKYASAMILSDFLFSENICDIGCCTALLTHTYDYFTETEICKCQTEKSILNILICLYFARLLEKLPSKIDLIIKHTSTYCCNNKICASDYPFLFDLLSYLIVTNDAAVLLQCRMTILRNAEKLKINFLNYYYERLMLCENANISPVELNAKIPKNLYNAWEHNLLWIERQVNIGCYKLTKRKKEARNEPLFTS